MTHKLSALPQKNIFPEDEGDQMLDMLQRESFNYFLKEWNKENGLIADKTQSGCPSSIAAVGIGLSCYISGIEQGYISREDAIGRTLKVLKFFDTSHQGPERDATGYKGFYYHFLDFETGKRAWNSELSTIDTAIFLAGVLSAKNYFTGKNIYETEIRRIADRLYLRVDWRWALNGRDSLTHGWKPESGFLRARWNKGYSEAHILYIMALGSPTFPIKPVGYHNWTETFELKRIYGIDCIYAGPLFIHQMAQIWLDFNGIRDGLNERIGFDYFDNSRRSTLIQQQYGKENPLGFAHYGEFCWGFTASDGPGPSRRVINGVNRKFYNYKARGVPFGPDDGTISPWAAAASLPFAPKVVINTLHHAIANHDFENHHQYGFDASFNPTFPGKNKNPSGWVSPWLFGINQGPVVLMIENYKSRLIWDLFKKCPNLRKGLQLAGFKGGWLEKASLDISVQDQRL